MSVRVLTQADVHELLPMQECVEVMQEALVTLARGDAVLPLRSMVRLPDGSGLLGLMPAYLGAPRVMGLKVVSVMPGNHGTAYDSHQGAVLLFEVEHGAPIAMIDGSCITAIRTAAVSAVATRVLARADAGDLAILGSGVQAMTHLEAMAVVRPLRRVRAWSRNSEHARAFASRAEARLGLAVEVAASGREAVEGADLVCTATSSRRPVLEGAWLAPGVHVNAVGACARDARELDTAAVAGARFYVDRRESALHEAGDLLIAREEGAVGDSHIAAELGEVLIGRAAGRRDPGERTVFESLGLAVEDLAAAHHVWRKAEASNRGVQIELGGLRERLPGAGE